METIVACSTPIAHSGIALVRMSGEKSVQIIEDLAKKKLRHRQASFCVLKDDKKIIDSCVVCLFIGPNSYTGENIVEISCHGNPIIIEHLIQQCVKRGARPARRGEFTKRALLNNKLSLLQAESIEALVHSTSLSGVQIAQKGVDGKIDAFIQKIQESILDICAELEARLDYPGDELAYINDEELVTRMYELSKEIQTYCSLWENSKRKIYGAKVALIGEVNAGKSSLFNRLVDMKRAIVSSIPGTTRDVIEKSVFLHGLEVCFYDTAGQRKQTSDEIEAQGILLGSQIIQDMDVIILVVHPQHFDVEKLKEITKKINKQCLVVFSHLDSFDYNKEKSRLDFLMETYPSFSLSSKTGEGIDDFKSALYQTLFHRDGTHDQIITSQRQYDILLKLSYYLLQSAEVLPDYGPAIAIDELTTCLESISEISGQDIRELVLDNLFSRFCIGK